MQIGQAGRDAVGVFFVVEALPLRPRVPTALLASVGMGHALSAVGHAFMLGRAACQSISVIYGVGLAASSGLATCHARPKGRPRRTRSRVLGLVVRGQATSSSAIYAVLDAALESGPRDGEVPALRPILASGRRLEMETMEAPKAQTSMEMPMEGAVDDRNGRTPSKASPTTTSSFAREQKVACMRGLVVRTTVGEVFAFGPAFSMSSPISR